MWGRSSAATAVGRCQVGRRCALLVAAHTFEDPALTRLRAPARDLDELDRVLGDPEVGAFDTRMRENPAAHQLREDIERFFAGRDPDDLLLVYYSGHGIKDESGELYLAACDTSPDLLGSRAVPAEFVKWCMRRSRARSVALILDCCYSGAFARGLLPRADDRVNVGEQLGGQGIAWMTASTALEYAFEDGEPSPRGEVGPSVFTRAIVEGLDTGAADRDGDGWITFEELYDHVYATVQERTPHQTPTRSAVDARGNLWIARRRPSRTLPASLLPEREPEARAGPEVMVLAPSRRGYMTLAGLRATGGLALLVLGFQEFYASAVLAGLLLVRSAAKPAMLALGSRTVLGRGGLTLVRPRRERFVPWREVTRIRVRQSLRKRTVRVRVGSEEFDLPAPRTQALAPDPAFAAKTRTIAAWWARHTGLAELPVKTRSLTMVAILGYVAAALPIGALLIADQPVYRLVGPGRQETKALPAGPCELAQPHLVDQLAPGAQAVARFYGGSGKVCTWEPAGQAMASLEVDLRLERTGASILATGTEATRTALIVERFLASKVDDTPTKLSGLGDEAYVFVGESSSRVVVLARRTNVLVKVTADGQADTRSAAGACQDLTRALLEALAS